MSDPSFTIPAPSGGAAGTAASDIENAEAKFYGEDIWYDLAAIDPNTGKPDYVVMASGDWAVATGLVALYQALVRRLITNPGDWQTLPTYGVGALQYVKRPRTPAVKADLEARIRSQFLQDDRVEAITKVDLEDINDDTDTPGLKITVWVLAKGRLRQDAALPVQIAIR